MASVIARNPTASAAREQLLQAEARLGQARAEGRTQLSFNSAIGASDARIIEPAGSETYGQVMNSLILPLPLLGKNRLAVSQSEQLVSAANDSFQSTLRSLRSEVTTAFYNVLRSQAVLAVAQSSADDAQRQLVDAQNRYKAGDVAELDVLRAETPVAQAKTSLIEAASQLSLANAALNALTGDDPLLVQPLEDKATAQPVDQPSLQEIQAKSVEESPDVAAADAIVRADMFAVRAARLSREPDLSLQASDLRSNDRTSFSRNDTLQVVLNVPLSDGGLAQGQIAEAEASLRQAEAQAASARLTVLQAADNAYLTAESSRLVLSAAAATRDIAQTTYGKTLLGYTNGLFPLSDLLSAQTAAAQARLTYVEAFYDAASASQAVSNLMSGDISSAIVDNNATP